jgi:tRNA G18 (ribose-2'-O)-methylase SpoU
VIQQIDRPDDPRIAVFRDVGDHRRLRASGLFVAEGRLVVRRLIELQRHVIEAIVVSPAALAELQDVLSRVAAPVCVCAPAVLQLVTGYNFHRGCVALARRPAESTMLDEVRHASRLMVLEGIANPDNIGGLFRVAAAFSVAAVLLAPTTGDPLYRKAIRTSSGLTIWTRFVTPGWSSSRSHHARAQRRFTTSRPAAAPLRGSR